MANTAPTVEQNIAGQRGEQYLDALGVGDRRGGLDDQLQRQHDQAQADRHAAHLADAGLLAREKEHDAEKQQQRRQPGQVEGQHPRHQRRADVGAEHDRQRRGQCHQALADEGSGQHGRGIAALHDGGHQDAGQKCQRWPRHVFAEQAPQVAAVDAQNAGTNDVRAPDQQGYRGKKIKQGQHESAPWQCCSW
jgi:hypothetical protein